MNPKHYPRLSLFPLLLAAAALAGQRSSLAARASNPAMAASARASEAIRADGIRAHVRYLSDDLLEGRDTGSRGGLLAAHYIASQLEQFGVRAAGDGDTYFQQIPFELRRIDAARSGVTLIAPGQNAETGTKLTYGADFLLNGASSAQVKLSAPLVFAGYGITAPEYQHDDYQALDVEGKVVVLISGEPHSADPAFFDGDKDTKYADGGSKIRLAREKGAVGVITILEGERSRRYPWQDARGVQGREAIELGDEPVSSYPTLLVREDGAAKLLSGAGHTWTNVEKQIGDGHVSTFALPQQATVELNVSRTPRPGPNVVGLVEGSDPALKQQAVIYSAHYDHVGKREGDGDVIFNGAWDNASGTASVLELARAFGAMKPAPKRSILFLFVTGEEKGLLGSRYYTRHPVVPMENTAADINLDMTDIFGIPKGIVPLGAEHSTLGSVTRDVAEQMGLTIEPDHRESMHLFQRSDQYSFVKAGVPSIFLVWGDEHEDTDAATVRARAQEKLDTIYHKVSDQFDPTWSWEGMRRQAQAAFLMGAEVANTPALPRWNPGDPFERPRAAPAL